MYYIILADRFDRRKFLEDLNAQGVNAVSHYVPLHSAPGGLRYGRTSGDLQVTDRVQGQLVRLPLWCGITVAQQDRVMDAVQAALSG